MRKSVYGRGLLGLVGAVAITASASGACSSSDDDTPACEKENVDALKELVVVDDGVMNDARAKNATDGVWSFRHAMENLAPMGVDPSDFVRRWLSDWVTRTELNGFLLDTPGEERIAGMNRLVLCPWMKQTPANLCNDDCSSCTAQKLDLAKSPFELIAIVNRTDLRMELGDAAPNGESRLVFALKDGPADDPTTKPLAMTVIFEYVLPPTKTLGEWAQAWHALGKYPTYDEPFRAELEKLTNSFVVRNSNPTAASGSALGQIRTNESTLDWIWQLRQFGLGADGYLELKPLRNTPPEQLNGTDALRSYVSSNLEAIRSDKYTLPPSMLAGSADALRYSWSLPGIQPLDARAFNLGTCNGCHTEHSATDTAFHVSPFRKGPERLSQFLYDPAGGGKDEITKRTVLMHKALCSP